MPRLFGKMRKAFLGDGKTEKSKRGEEMGALCNFYITQQYHCLSVASCNFYTHTHQHLLIIKRKALSRNKTRNATRSISIRIRRHVQLPPSLSKYIPDVPQLINQSSTPISIINHVYYISYISSKYDFESLINPNKVYGKTAGFIWSNRTIHESLVSISTNWVLNSQLPKSLRRRQPSDFTETETEIETEEMMLRAAASRAQKRFPLWVRSSSSTHRTADPALHSGDTEGSDPNEEQAVKGLPPKKPTQDFDKGEGENHHHLHQSSSSSSSENFTVKTKLSSHPVNKPIDPNIQQKRHLQSSETTELEKVSCVGFDGTPIPMNENEEERRNQDDDKEYFKDRKPSALSEIEIADTRKPITRAIDETPDSFDTREIEKTGWREEQIDTAEEALRRASMIWKEAAMRGDPDAPQSRALRQLLAERGDDFCLN